jgi:hypothetical protein
MGIQKPLIRLLLSNHACLATDPRDKAYALLGLASDGQELVPAPNYRQSVQSVLEDLIRAMLMSQGCANMAVFRSTSRDPGRQSAILGPRLEQLGNTTRPYAGTGIFSRNRPRSWTPIQRKLWGFFYKLT